MANGKGNLGVHIGGGVSNALLQGLSSLRSQLTSLANAARDTGKSNASSGLNNIANNIKSATDTLKDSADVTGEGLRRMFKEVADAAQHYANEMRSAAGAGDSTTQEMTDMDQKGQALAEMLANLSRSLSGMSDEDLKKAATELRTTTQAMDKMSDDAEETAKSIQALEDQWRIWTATLTDPQGIFSAKKALANLADGIYGTERALKDAGYEMEGWADKLEAEKLQAAFQKGLIEPTKRGFRIHHDAASEFINLTKDQIRVVNQAANAMSALDKELQRVNQWDKLTEGQRNYINSLDKLKQTKGEDTQITEKWLAELKKSDSALASYKARFDEADTEMRQLVDTVDRYSIVQASLNGDLKVTKDGIQVLTKRGLAPFKEMSLETVDSLGLLGRSLRKHLKDTNAFQIDPIKRESIKNLEVMKDSFKNLYDVTNQYLKILNELKAQEDQNIEGATELRQAWEALAEQYQYDNAGISKVKKNLDSLESTIKSQVSALGEQEKAFASVFHQMDRAAAYKEIYGKGENLKIQNGRLQALTKEGLKPFGDVTEETASKIGLLHKSFGESTQYVSFYEKKLTELRHAQEQGSESAKKLRASYESLGAQYKKDDEAASKVYANLRKMEQAIASQISALKEEDKAYADVIRQMDRISAYKEIYGKGENLKIQNNRLQALTKEGLKPFGNMTEEVASKLGILHNKFGEVTQYASFYEKTLAELRHEEAKGDENVKKLREAYEQLGKEYIKNDEGAKKVYNNLRQLERAIASQTSALREEDKAYADIIRQMDRVSAYGKIWGEGDDLRILNNRLQATNREGLIPFGKVTEDAAHKLGILHRSFEKNVASVDRSKKEFDEWTESVRRAAGENEAHRIALQKLGERYGKDVESLDRYNSAVLNAHKNINRYVDTKRAYIASLQDEIKKRQAAGQEIKEQQRLLEKYTEEVRQAKNAQSLSNESMHLWQERVGTATKGTSTFTKANKELHGQLSIVDRMMGAITNRMRQFAAFMVAAIGIHEFIRVIRVTVTVIGEFDQALYNLQAIIEITIDQARILGDTIRDVARETKFSATEVAEGVRLLGQSGLSMTESMQATNGVARLATGTMEKFGSVVDLVTTSLNAFQLEATVTSRIADVFANAINASKLNIDKLNTAFNYVGAAGHQAGLAINQIAGSLMTLADNGLRASTMGTGLRRMLLKMLSPSEDLRNALLEVGMSLDDINPKVVGLQDALKNLAPLMWDFDKDVVDMGKAVDYFGTRAAQVAAVMIRESGMNGAIASAIEKTRELGSAADMAALQQEGLSLKFKNLVDRAKNVIIALGDTGLTTVIKDVTDALRAAAEAAEMLIKAIPALFQLAGLSTVIGGVSITVYGLVTLLSSLLGKVKVVTASFTSLSAIFASTAATIVTLSAVVSGLIWVIHRFETRFERMGDTMAKTSEKTQKLANDIQTYGQILAHSADEGAQEFSNAVHYMEQDAEEAAKILAKDLGYTSLSEMAEGFEKGTDRAIEAMNKLKGAADDTLASYERLSGKEFEKSANEMIEAIAATQNEIDRISKRAQSETGALGIGNILGDESEIEKQRALIEDRMSRILLPAITSAAAKGNDATKEVLMEHLDSTFKESFGEHQDLYQKFADNVIETFKEMNAEGGVSVQELRRTVLENSKEIQALIDKLDPFQAFEYRKSVASIKKQVAEFQEDIVNNTEYTSSKILKLVSEFKRRLQEEQLENILGMGDSSGREEWEKELDELELYYKKMRLHAEENSQEMIGIKRDELQAQKSIYEDTLEKVQDDPEKLDELKGKIIDIKKELKDLDTEERDYVYDRLNQNIENRFSAKMLNMDDDSLAYLRAERDQIQELLNLQEEKLASAVNPAEEQAFEAERLALQKKLADKEEDILDKRAETYEDATDKRIEAIDRELTSTQLMIDKQSLLGKISESEAIEKMAEAELKAARESFNERKSLSEKMKKEFGDQSDEHKEAMKQQKEAAEEVEATELNRLEATMKAAEKAFETEMRIAERRKELATMRLPEEEARFRLVDSSDPNVIANIEKVVQSSYDAAKTKLDAEKEYTKRMKELHDERIRSYEGSRTKENQEFQEMLFEREQFVAESNQRIMELEQKAARERINEQGSLWEKTKLGLMDFSEEYENASKTWAENTKDAATASKDAWNDAFSDFILGTENAKNAFKSFAESILEQMADILAQSVTKQFIGLLMKAGVGMIGSGSSVAQSPGANPDVSPMAMGFAKGDVIRGSGINEFANKIVDKMTVFPMAKGLGVMGEAGPEAVMPLTRTKGGDLGVRSEDSAPNVEVNVINKTGENVDADKKDSRFDGEKWVLDVVLNAANKNKNNFGKNLKGTLRKA